MESFKALRRRTTDLLQSIPQNLPSIPSMKSPKPTLKGTWQRIAVPPLKRSSHTMNIVSGTAYIFGGEISPRQPVDNDMHVVSLPFSSAPADYYAIKAVPAKPDTTIVELIPEGGEGAEAQPREIEMQEVPLSPPPVPAPAESSEDKGKGKEIAPPEKPKLGDVPEPRVGHATAVIGHRIFMFGGRGGPDMPPLDEGGRVWVFDTRGNTWTYLDPEPPARGIATTAVPAPRSYHCACATEKPRDFAIRRPNRTETWQAWAEGDSAKVGIPQAPIVGNVAAAATDEDSEGYGTFIIHAGCVAGPDKRTNDVWAFDVRSRVWSELPAAPGPARGGSAICLSKSRLFRFGGFDGTDELGGQIDFLHLEVELFDDGASKGEVAVNAKGGWQSILQGQAGNEDEIETLVEQVWPGNRSVAGLEALTVGGGREYLLLAMGESSASSDGHAAAGKFYDDVWVFQVPPLGMSAASFRDAMWQAIGRPTGEGKWTKVEMGPYDDDNDEGAPGPRGWIATAPMGDLEENAVVIWGGLDSANKRLGDGWILRLG
jgi:Kelch motif